MAGFESIAIPLASGALGIAGQAGQQNAAQKAQAQQAEAANQTLADQYERESRKRRSLLEREMATARARLGAMGVGGAGGSGAAVLDGLQQRADQDQAELRDEVEQRMVRGQARTPGASSVGVSTARLGLDVLRPFVGSR